MDFIVTKNTCQNGIFCPSVVVSSVKVKRMLNLQGIKRSFSIGREPQKSDFKKLRQLLLIEEFKKCLPSEVKAHLDEKKVEVLSQAGVLADNYILTHKSTGQRT